MSNLNAEEGSLNSHDIELIQSKRIVFIIDEAHRSTFGDMLITIKSTFPAALFFGFTGTPIQDENQKEMNTTATVFGDELHRYSIADGIRDKNVLGFDPYKVMTYKDKDLRKAVALEKAKSEDESEALSDPNKKKVFNHFMQQVKMAGYTDDAGKMIKGIEDYLPKSQYKRDEHRVDLLIVVDQMLMGFDSKWLNTLYMDKVLKYENIIQAFSRTNRSQKFKVLHGVSQYILLAKEQKNQR